MGLALGRSVGLGAFWDFDLCASVPGVSDAPPSSISVDKRLRTPPHPRYITPQVTADLAGFWKTSYDLVRRDMKGRYPRHYWPEDPSEAEATKMTKKQMEKAAAAAAAAQGGDAVGAKAGAAAGPGDKGGKKRKGK